MLVLTRKKCEMIRIGDDIVIKVIATGRGKVKLGIDAPNHVRVLRSELQEAINRHELALREQHLAAADIAKPVA